MIWTILQSLLSGLIKPVFEFLNKRVDADLQKHVVDTKTAESIGLKALDNATRADEVQAKIRANEGTWGPTVICMLIILAPMVWHEWQVVLDSSRWVPAIGTLWGFIPYPTVVEHTPGMWRVPALPEPWQTVELAIFQSFFIGATSAITAVAIIKAIKR